MKLTVSQYKTALQSLSPRHLEILQVLYHFPNSSATAKQLAQALNYQGFQGANRQIGAIGESIQATLDIAIPEYIDRGEPRPAYFYLIGEYNDNGWNMWPNIQKALKELKLVEDESSKNVHVDRLPTEIMPFDEKQFYYEGKVTEVFVNRYERSLKARQACLMHYGPSCQGCGFEFSKVYGSSAAGFLHVHHLRELSDIKKNYKVDPINDLIPLCPNCHSVVHMSKPALPIEKLKGLMKKALKAR